MVRFPHVLQHFRADHPDVHLHPSAALVARLGRGELDLVACVQPPEIPVGVETEPLMVEELAVYGPDGSTPADPATWGPWVLFPSGSHTRRDIAESLGRLGARVDVVADSHQPEVLHEMVRLGVGWTFVPTVQAESGDRPLRGRRPLTTRRVVTARRAGAIVDTAVDDLATALRRPAPAPPASRHEATL